MWPQFIDKGIMSEGFGLYSSRKLGNNTQI